MAVTSCNWLRVFRGLVAGGPAEHAAEHRAWLALWVVISTLLVTCSPLQLDRIIRQPRGSAHRLNADSSLHHDAGSEDVPPERLSIAVPASAAADSGTTHAPSPLAALTVSREPQVR